MNNRAAYPNEAESQLSRREHAKIVGLHSATPMISSDIEAKGEASLIQMSVQHLERNRRLSEEEIHLRFERESYSG